MDHNVMPRLSHTAKIYMPDFDTLVATLKKNGRGDRCYGSGQEETAFGVDRRAYECVYGDGKLITVDIDGTYTTEGYYYIVFTRVYGFPLCAFAGNTRAILDAAVRTGGVPC